MSMPSGVDSEDASSPDDSRPHVEVFDLSESSSESISPDMESQALFIKLKEVSGSSQPLHISPQSSNKHQYTGTVQQAGGGG